MSWYSQIDLELVVWGRDPKTGKPIRLNRPLNLLGKLEMFIFNRLIPFSIQERPWFRRVENLYDTVVTSMMG
jgi:hypothetical protein